MIFWRTEGSASRSIYGSKCSMTGPDKRTKAGMLRGRGSCDWFQYSGSQGIRYGRPCCGLWIVNAYGKTRVILKESGVYSTVAKLHVTYLCLYM